MRLEQWQILFGRSPELAFGSLCGILLMIAQCSPALAAQPASVKALLMQAMDSPDGASRGIIEGQEADKIHAVTGASDPVRAEVSTIRKFKQEGCSRLKLRLIQPNAPTRDGKRMDFALDYELNLCRDGSPPSEGMDLGQAAAAFGSH